MMFQFSRQILWHRWVSSVSLASKLYCELPNNFGGCKRRISNKRYEGIIETSNVHTRGEKKLKDVISLHQTIKKGLLYRNVSLDPLTCDWKTFWLILTTGDQNTGKDKLSRFHLYIKLFFIHLMYNGIYFMFSATWCFIWKLRFLK